MKKYTRVLLTAGIIAAVIYSVGDVLSGLLYRGYSFRDQAISELTAIGSPVRPLMVAVIVAYGLLMLVFALGIWMSAGPSRSLRVAALILVITGIIGLVLHPFFPMSTRGLAGDYTFTNTMHQILTMANVIPIMGAVLAGAMAFRGRFRFYTIVTLVVLIVGGIGAGLTIQGIDQNNTPWAGAFERINAYALNLWFAVLAVNLIRHLNQLHVGRTVEAPAGKRVMAS